jgi:acyl carrier protein
MESNRIHGIDCTPSQLRAWIAAGLLERESCPLRLVLVGGEPIDPDLWSVLAQYSRIDFYNVYGPTESTVDATAARLRDDTAQPHIGRPIANRRVYILNRHGQPAPIAVAGEICLGGAGVARGYLHQPELTASRFVADPFCADARARMYKTGDLGRWRADGTIEYLGRNDHQVKVRGFRIELGEIEAQLARHAEVNAAVVLSREDVPGEHKLVAYVQRCEQSCPSVDGLREHLRSALPDYMVPSAFVIMDGFPLTASGKVDRRALPVPDFDSYVSRSYEAPQGEVEEVLAGIWEELLRVQRVGRNDNFFDLGGHSLLGMQVVVRVRSLLSVELPMRALFDFPTLEQMSAQVDALRRAALFDSLASGDSEIDELLKQVTAMPDAEVQQLVRELRGGRAP